MFATNWRAVLPGRDPRPADDQRDADRRLVEHDLALRHAVLAVHEAVVRREDDVRVVELAGRRQRVDDLRRRPRRPRAATRGAAGSSRGSRASLAGVSAARFRIAAGLSETSASLNDGGAGSGSFAKRLRWRGAGDGVEIRSGRRGRAAPPQCGATNATQRKNGRGSVAWRRDQVDGLARVDVGLVVRRAVAVVHERAVLVQRVVVVAVRRRVRRAVPLAPARRDLLGRSRAVPVQVLADVDRLVAGALEPDGKRVRRVELVVAAVRRRVAPDAVVVRVLAREEGRARRAAERVRDEAVVERDALVGEQRLHVRHDAHRLERLVVGHDHDDVRAGRGLRLPPRRRR